jgi:hypothetical protein
MRLHETARRHPRIIAATTALIMGAGAIEAAGFLENPSYGAPASSCVSPVAASRTYVDRDTNTLLQTDTGFFTTGVVARGTLPKGAYGVEASFESPGTGQMAWDRNDSRMIKANRAGGYTLNMAIGSGEVQFGVRVVAPEGSLLCNTPPDVAYIHENATDYFNTSGTLPWRNPVNEFVDVF